MAQINGYVSIPHGSYDQFKQATLGNGYNADGYYGNQCWDYLAELWHQYGLILYTGSQGYAYECWTVSKNRNAVTPFIAIEGITNIKRGDVIVLSGLPSLPAGHIALADEAYNGSNYLNILGQHQGEASSAAASFVNVRSFEIGSRFLGIFRNTNWDGSPPPPGPTPVSELSDTNFPWHLYARRLRKRR